MARNKKKKKTPAESLAIARANSNYSDAIIGKNDQLYVMRKGDTQWYTANNETGIAYGIDPIVPDAANGIATAHQEPVNAKSINSSADNTQMNTASVKGPTVKTATADPLANLAVSPNPDGYAASRWYDTESGTFDHRSSYSAENFPKGLSINTEAPLAPRVFSSAAPIAPSNVSTANLSQEGWINDDYYVNSDGIATKNQPGMGFDRDATQAEIDAFHKSNLDDKNNSWGANEYKAAGAVMSGAADLYGGYMALQNYKLAKDARADQKQQWQDNYNSNRTSYNNQITQRKNLAKYRGGTTTEGYDLV